MRGTTGLLALPFAVVTIAAMPAQALDVDLELVLAIDISRSVDDEEAQLQRDGYMQALTDPRIIDAIRAGPLGRIAVTYIEWAGAGYQQTIVDWAVIDGPDSAKSFALKIGDAPRVAEMWTSISGALVYSAAKFDDNGFEGKRLVIDVSGDGRNNSGPDAATIRDAVVARGITINGLPIMSERANFGRPPERDLDIYYEQNVIGGPGAFIVPALDFPDFARAVRTKLIKEISGRPDGAGIDRADAGR
ncbi:MAG: DUF1194 domain-containing protein [Reyranellaceae bacterium]